MNFYLLYGTDTSIIGREIDIIKEKLSISDNDVIYYNIEDIQNVVDEALTISMFSANKLIVIDSTIYLSQKKDIENINLLENYFNNYNSNSYLVFVSNSDTIDSRKKLVKFINSNGTTKKVEANNEYLSDYVNDYLKKKNYKMSSMDINIFINRVGNNIDNIKNELDKLMLYKINDKVINNSDIMLLTEENTDNSVYDLVSALLKNNNSKAIKLYKNFVMNGIDLNQIIAIIASQIRLLFQVKRLYNSGKSNDEIAKILEFKSVYRVKYLLSDSYYYSEDTLIKYLSKLSNIDRDIKINNIDGNILLELLLQVKIIKKVCCLLHTFFMFDKIFCFSSSFELFHSNSNNTPRPIKGSSSCEDIESSMEFFISSILESLKLLMIYFLISILFILSPLI